MIVASNSCGAGYDGRCRADGGLPDNGVQEELITGTQTVVPSETAIPPLPNLRVCTRFITRLHYYLNIHYEV